MSITGPDFIWLPASNFDRAVTFYESVLGLHRIASSAPREAVFATHPIPISVREFAPAASHQDVVSNPSAVASVWLHSSNLQSLYADLVANNTIVHRTPADGRFGKELTFSDTEGNVITVHERG